MYHIALLLYFYPLLMTLSIVLTDNPYCKISKCLQPEDHILCKMAPCEVACNQSSFGEDPKFREVILDKLNLERANVATGTLGLPSASNMQVLSWDKELEFVANCMLNTCNYLPNVSQKQPPMCRVTSRGETIYTARRVVEEVLVNGKSKKNVLKELVSDWAKVYTEMDKLIAKFSGDAKHHHLRDYAQLIWADTQFVGCARRTIDVEVSHIKTIVYCNFAPEGAKADMEIYKLGETCSSDVENGQYPGLCGRIRAEKEDLYRPPFEMVLHTPASYHVNQTGATMQERAIQPLTVTRDFRLSSDSYAQEFSTANKNITNVTKNAQMEYFVITSPSNYGHAGIPNRVLPYLPYVRQRSKKGQRYRIRQTETSTTSTATVTTTTTESTEEDTEEDPEIFKSTISWQQALRKYREGRKMYRAYPQRKSEEDPNDASSWYNKPSAAGERGLPQYDTTNWRRGGYQHSYITNPDESLNGTYLSTSRKIPRKSPGMQDEDDLYPAMERGRNISGGQFRLVRTSRATKEIGINPLLAIFLGFWFCKMFSDFGA